MNAALKRTILLFVFFVCAFVLTSIYFPVKQKETSKQELSDIEKFLLETTNKLNSRLPMVIDSETRLDNTMGVNNQMRYNFTLTNYTAEEANVTEFKDALDKQMSASICSTHNMDIFFTKGISVTYAYFGKNGKFFHEKSIRPSDCSS